MEHFFPELTALFLVFLCADSCQSYENNQCSTNFLSSSKFKASADLHFLDSWKLMASQTLVALVIYHPTLLPCLTVILLRFSSHKFLISEMVFQQISLLAVDAAPPHIAATVLFPQELQWFLPR